MLLALEDGFRLHRLIDPATTPADSFMRAVDELQKLAVSDLLLRGFAGDPTMAEGSCVFRTAGVSPAHEKSGRVLCFSLGWFVFWFFLVGGLLPLFFFARPPRPRSA
jgi:hypothetical protein